MKSNKAILFSAPSGCGKTTIIQQLLQQFDCFEFSISATTRKPRGQEVNGVDYYFLSLEDFERKVNEGLFVEWEEVYDGLRYGTLRSEIDRIWSNGHTIIFDVDVRGGMNLKRYFESDALSVFIMPPSLKVLEERLRGRGTDTEASIQKRLQRSAIELKEAEKFDKIVVNDVLTRAVDEAASAIRSYLDL